MESGSKSGTTTIDLFEDEGEVQMDDQLGIEFEPQGITQQKQKLQVPSSTSNSTTSSSPIANTETTQSLKDKLLSIFTNVGSKSLVPLKTDEPVKLESDTTNSPSLWLEENGVSNTGNASNKETNNTFAFRIVAKEEEDEYDNENETYDHDTDGLNTGATTKALSSSPPMHGEYQSLEVDFADLSQKNSNSRKQSYESVGQSDRIELISKQITDFEAHTRVSADTKAQDNAQIITMLNQYETIRIIRNPNTNIVSNNNDQNSAGKQSENKEPNVNGIKKGEILMQIEYDQQLHRIQKESKKKKGFFGFLSPRVTRFICFENDSFVVLEKQGRSSNSPYRVCSVTPLADLFKIYSDRTSSQIRFYFLNKERSHFSAPINKLYDVDNKQALLLSLKKALNRQAIDFQFN